MSFCITKEDIRDNEVLGDKLVDLAGIVFRKHFYASMGDKEDLISVGILKAISLIKGGNWNESKGTVLNYLYAGMRNEMHNYLYHQRKEIKVEEVLYGCTTDNYFEDECFKIEYEIIELVCKDFLMYGDLRNLVGVELKNRGFSVSGYENIKNSRFLFEEDFKIDLIDRLCGAVLWKSREYSH